MPYEITWYQENHALHIKLLGIVTPEEIEAMTADSFQKVQQAQNLIHAIVDQSQMQAMPFKLSNIKNSLNQNKHPNQGITVLVIPQANKVYRFLGSMIFQMMAWEYRMAETLEEAEAIILKVDNYKESQ